MCVFVFVDVCMCVCVCVCVCVCMRTYLRDLAGASVDDAEHLVLAGGGVGGALVVPLDVLDELLVHPAVHRL